MKRFIVRICMFCLLIFLPLLGIITVVEHTLRQIPNDYSYKNQWLTAHAKSIQILSLGSSHGFYGIQPTAFSRSTFNAAHVSQDLHFNAFIWDKFKAQMDSLECVILPISYGSIRSKGIEYSGEKWRVKYYTIYYDCPYFQWSLDMALESYPFNINRLYDALSSSETNHRTCDSLGYGTSYSITYRGKDWQNSGPIAVKRHTSETYTEKDVQNNIAHITHIVEDCERRHIKVVLLTTPTYHTYYDILNPEQRDEMIQCCERIVNEYSNTLYLNLLENCSFDEGDFFDADHLNEYGAEKLSRMLDMEITKFLQCPYCSVIP